MIAEKPSLAASIAKFHSNGKSKPRKGISPVCAVHEYTADFQAPKEPKSECKFKVTSVAGHVFTLDFPREYNNWDTVNPVELFEAEPVKEDANPKTHIIKHLKQEAKGVDSVVLWLDCDREGENM